MKRIVKAFLIAIILLPNSCTNTEKSHHEYTDTLSHLVSKTIYSCLMHSEILSEKSGVCPECKIDLVAKSGESLDDSTEQSGQETHQQKNYG